MAARTIAEVGVCEKATFSQLLGAAVVNVQRLEPSTLCELAKALDVADLADVPEADAFVVAASPVFLAAATVSCPPGPALVQPMNAMDWVHLAAIAHARQHLHPAVEALGHAFREKIYAP